MLPLEASLLATGWPSESALDGEDAGDDKLPDDGADGANGGRQGLRASRLLFMAKRAERMLMSYERTGWVEDEPVRVTGRMEIRPAAELGPIIVCLDTSGSMQGARETVAKAAVLECMRGAHRQQRKCYVYAFRWVHPLLRWWMGVGLP
jgi:Mg-chelatase subunit ChlD